MRLFTKLFILTTLFSFTFSQDECVGELDCNDVCSGTLGAGTWTNTNPGGAVVPGAPTTLFGSADDGSWALSPCVYLDGSTVDNGDGTVTITSEYGADADHDCALSSDVFNGEVVSENVSTHNLPDYSVVGDIAFTLSSANDASFFSVTSTGTSTGSDENYSLIGTLSGGSSGGDFEAQDECGVCDGGNADQDCTGTCFGDAEVDSFNLCGNNDSLQGAIDAADEGGVLDIPAGTYTGPFTIDKSLTLNGAGQDAVFIQNADISADVIKICYSSGDVCDVTIQGVTIRNGRYGIYSKSTGSVNILNNTFYHNGYDGAELPDPESATAQADYAALWASASTSSGGAMRIRNSNGSEIAGNSVHDNLRGIRFQDSHDGSIHDNASYNNFESGIYLAAGSYTGATGCSNTNVFDNEVYGNRNNGLLSIGGIGNTFTNNNVHDNWSSGVMMWHVADNTFTGNTIAGNNIYSFNGIGNNGDAYAAVTSKGVDVDAGASYNFILEGNTISNNGNGNQDTAIGVFVEDGLPSTTISNNVFSGQDPDISYGDSTTASGNTCSAGCDCNSGSVADCAGVCDGDSALDDCGVCDGGNADQDCTGVCGGNNYINVCDLCVASEQDTDGDGVIDDCDDCPNDILNDSDGDGSCDSDDICPDEDDFLDTDEDGTVDCLDEWPECADNGSLPYDCAGFCNGPAVVDECGECGGDGIDEGACDCDGNVLDCTNACGGNAWIDCNDECNGTALLDACGECDDDGEGDNMSTCVDAGDDIELDCPMDCEAGCTMDVVLDGLAVGEDLDCNWSVGSRDSEPFPLELTLEDGEHEYTLTCTDEDGTIYSDSIVITIVDDADYNTYPTFDLAAEHEFTTEHSGDPDTDQAPVSAAPTNVHDDFEDQELSYSWTQTSGNVITGGTYNTESLSVSAAPGDYGFELTVSDCYGSGDAKETMIHVLDAPNEGPESIPSAYSETATEVESSADDFTTIFDPLHSGDDSDYQQVWIFLDGTNSADEDGDALDYVWTPVTANGTPWDLNPDGLYDYIFNYWCDEDNDEDLYDCSQIGFLTYANWGPATYYFELEVTDTYGDVHSQIITIVINEEPNEAPVVSAMAAITEALPHDGEIGGEMDITLTCEASDVDGDLITYQWQYGSQTYDGQTLVVSLSSGSDQTFTCVATDSYESSDSSDQVVHVNPESNDVPTAEDVVSDGEIPHNGYGNQYDGGNSTLVSVCANASDSDGDELTYEWSLGGVAITSENDLHTLACIDQDLTAGTHTFTYIATDSYDAPSDAATVTWVLTEPNDEPTAMAGDDQSHNLIHDGVVGGSMDVTLDGCGSFDAEGDSLVSYQWSKGETILGLECLLEDISLEESENEFCLVVTDTYGLPHEDCLTVTVEEEHNSAPEFEEVDSDLEFTLERDGDAQTLTVEMELCAEALDSDANEDSESDLFGENDEVIYSWFTMESDEVDLGSTECISIGLDGNFYDEDLGGDQSIDYVLTVVASDAYGEESELDFNITIHPEENSAPVAQTDTYITAQPEHDGTPGGEAIVHISAVNSFDVDGDDLECSWSADGLDLTNAYQPGTQLPVDGSSECEFDVVISHDSADGADNLYTFELTVADIYGAESSSDLLVELLPEDNATPVVDSASCTTDEMEHDGIPGGSVDVTCEVSVSDSDNDDWGIEYEWCYGEDDDELCFDTNSFLVTVSADDDNQADLEFSACDAYDDCGTATVMVTGVEPNTAPTVSSEQMDGPDYQWIYLEHDHELGGASTHNPFYYLSFADAEGDALTYVFSYGGEIDTVLSTNDYSIAIDDVGEVVWYDQFLDDEEWWFGYETIVVEFYAIDAYGANSNVMTYDIIPYETSYPPSATAGDDMLTQVPHDGIPGAGEACVILDESGAVDSDDQDYLDIDWRPIPGERDDDETGSEICLSGGSYLYELVVTDPYGLSARDTLAITVQSEDNNAPTVSSFSCTVGETEHTGSYDTDTAEVICVANAEDQDPFDSDLLSYTPIQLSGDGVTTIELTEEDEELGENDYGFSFTAAPGTYEFSMVATDPYGEAGNSLHTATITDAENDVPVIVIADQDVIPDNGDVTEQSYEVAHDNDPDTDTALVTIDACESTDSHDDALTFSWSLANADEIDEDGCSISMDLEADNYVFTVTVCDSYDTEENSSCSEETITVSIAGEINETPVADAGFDVTGQQLDHDEIPGGCFTHTLDGSATQDLDTDDALTYVWSDDNSSYEASGEMVEVSICLDPENNPDHEDGAHTYTYTLEVCDGYADADNFVACSTDQVSITVTQEDNEAPEAIIDPILDAIQPEDNCDDDEALGCFMLTSTSTDSHNDSLSCSWIDVETAGGYLSSDQCEVEVCRPEGDYVFELTVEDGYEASDAATITVSVNAEDQENEAPVAIANEGENLDLELPHDGEEGGSMEVQLYSSSEDDQCEDDLVCEWRNTTDSNDYVISDSCATSVELEEGSYEYTLTVTDPHGEDSATTIAVAVAPEHNHVPEGIAAEDQEGTLAHDGVAGGCGTFEFEASASDLDPEDTLEYHYSSNGTLCEGEHDITVYATDPYDASTDTLTFEFTVLPEENSAPVAMIIGSESAYQLESNCIEGGSLDIDTISGIGSDVEQDDVYYVWTSCYEDIDIEDAYTATPTLKNLEEGDYCLRLRVTDVYGDYSEAETTFSVTAEDNVLPVANAGDDQIDIEIDHDGTPNDGTVVVTLDCGASTDDCHDNLGAPELDYVWTDSEGVGLANTQLYEPALIAGSYEYTCTVTDNYGEESSDDVVVTTYEPNAIATPVLTFSDDLEAVHAGTVTVTIDGGDTEDPDEEDALTYHFIEIVDGEEVDLSDGASDFVERVLEPGDYTFGLRVRDAYMTDNNGTPDDFTDDDILYTEFVYDTITVTHDNDAPDVQIQETELALDIPHSCDGTDYINHVVSALAVDPNGDEIYSHEWTDNGDVVCEASACNLSLNAGTHTLVYTACDQYEDCNSDEVSIEVSQINDTPVASGSSDDTVVEGNEICFDASDSSDECDLAYSWSLDGEELSSNSEDCFNAPMVENNPGEDFEYVLTVTDVYGVSDSMSINVYVDNDNIDPVVTLGGDQEVQVEHDHDPETTQYSLDTSTIIMVSDDDNDDLSYSWTVDGEEVSTEVVPVLDLDSGVRVIGCTVDDGYLGVTSATVGFFVNAEENECPVADAGDNIQVFSASDAGALIGSESSDADDPDSFTCTWSNTDQVSYGEEVEDIEIENIDGCRGLFDVPDLATNSYVIMSAELAVVDPYSCIDTDEIAVVIVNDNRAPEEMADDDGDRDIDINIYPEDDCDPSTFECSYSLDATYTDPDYDDLQFDWYLDGEWAFSDYKYYSPDGMISTLDLDFSSTGDYVLEVVVTDVLPTGEYYDDPISVFKTWNLHVLPEGSDNIAPVAISTTEDTEIPHDGYPETVETVVDLSIESSDENGHELTYEWYLDDDAISEESDESSFSYEVYGSGSYDFMVRVRDCYTHTDLSINVFVAEEMNLHPTADAGEDQIIDLSGDWSCEGGEQCEFIYEGDVLLINALNSIDPEDDPMTYSWTQLSGPEVEIEYVDDSSISFVVPKPDDINSISLEFELLANDSYAAESTDNIVITINSLYIDNSIELIENTELVSLYAMPDLRDIPSVFGSLEDDGVQAVIGEGEAAYYTDVNGSYQWIGNLTEVDPRSGYWIRSTGDDDPYDDEPWADLNLMGVPIDCSLEYNLEFGGNLISYSGHNGVSIHDAVSSDYSDYLACEDSGIDVGLVGAGVAATYHPILGWVGSLDELNQNDGYWFKSCYDFTFSWNCDDDIASRSSDAPKQKLERYPDGFEYLQSTQQAFYFIKDAKIDGEELSDESWIIAYNDNVVVGARQWIGPYTDVPFMGYDNTDRTLGYGQAGDAPHFKVFIPSTGELLDMDATEVRTWANNDLSFVDNVSATSAGSAIPNEIALGNAYPNPFNPSTSISFSIPNAMHVDVSIYDTNGRMVEQLVNGVKSAGVYEINWNAGLNASGVYFIRFNAEGNVHTQKILLIK